MSATRIAIAMAFVAGLAGSAQAALAGTLGRRIGTVQAATFSVLATAVVLLVVAVVTGRGAGIVDAIRQPPWLWLAGPLGAVILFTITFAPPRIGTFATVALLIAGQLIAGAAIDAFGWLGTERIPITAARIGGLVLLTAGAALSLKR
jgi:transporter family-2 protein